MLFHVFEWKALCCPKDMSALDDLVHDFVYCLQVSLVLKALRLFARLLRFPRRENRHGYWTLLCLQRAREARRSWAERRGAITQAFAPSGCVITALAFWEREEERSCAWCPTQVVLLLPCHLARLLSQVWFKLKAFHCPTFLPSHSKVSGKF